MKEIVAKSVVVALLMGLALSAGASESTPIANAGIDRIGFTNLNMYFSGTGSTGPEFATYHWDFGDGASVTSDFSGVLHAFSSPGVYTVTLTVSSFEGEAYDTAEVTIMNDTVEVVNALWLAGSKSLLVQATSNTEGMATLTVLGQGTMTYNSSRDQYTLMKRVNKKPSSVTIVSSSGGSVTVPVQ